MMKRRWFRRSADVTCREVGRALQSYLDGDVETDFAAKIAEHLEKCKDCGLEEETYQQIKDSLARQQPGVDDEAIERPREFGRKLTSD